MFDRYLRGRAIKIWKYLKLIFREYWISKINCILENIKIFYSRIVEHVFRKALIHTCVFSNVF